jgi:hypothetical protein
MDRNVSTEAELGANRRPILWLWGGNAVGDQHNPVGGHADALDHPQAVGLRHGDHGVRVWAHDASIDQLSHRLSLKRPCVLVRHDHRDAQQTAEHRRPGVGAKFVSVHDLHPPGPQVTDQRQPGSQVGPAATFQPDHVDAFGA